MKILIVNTYDIQGGAARAAYRLHRSLLSQGIDSHMMVQHKSSDDYTVKNLDNSLTDKILNKLHFKYEEYVVNQYADKTETLFTPAMFTFRHVIDAINAQNPDIVHLHWISKELLGVEGIAQIKAPIVWSLHDMWAFTGGCHYDEECTGYESQCGNCKVLGSEKEKDLSRSVFQRKQKVFTQKKDITIVGLSRWLHACSKNSTLLKDKKHVNIPNPIDTSTFKPFDKIKARELWSLPKDKRLVLYGAMGATSDPRKGFKELSKALPKLNSQDVELVVFGSSEPQNAPDFGFATHYLGHLYDEVSLVTLYSAVDVMVVPSLQENLSNAIMESLACGTPVVGFDVGGNCDMIEHKKNGYLAKPFDTRELKDGIEWVLRSEDYDELCTHAREKVVREFDSAIVAKRYIGLYEDVLKNDSCNNS